MKMRIIIISALILTLIVIAIRFFAYSRFPAIPAPQSLIFNNESFTNLANEIVKQNKIYEMDDCSKYTKRLNGISIKMNEGDSSQSLLCCIVYYKNILDSLSIDQNDFESLKDQLSKTGLYSFYK